MLEPDRHQLDAFAGALFRHASAGTFVSLRGFFEDDSSKPFRITPTRLSDDRKFLIDAIEDDARRAANHPRPVVFCPPVATFSNQQHARESDLAEGLALSVECDQRPLEALAKLEQVIGRPTVVVVSGGKWIDPTTGQIFDKLHLHWRLRAPARGKDLAKLKQARDLAARLVGGDPSNKPIVHPIRWPGSWHRKGEPTLCKIEESHPDAEIDLDAALASLTSAAPAAATKASGANVFEAFGKATKAPADWSELMRGISSGENYHDNITRLAAMWVTSGMSDGAAVNSLRALMEGSSAPHDARWQARYDDIPRSVASARAKFDTGKPQGPEEKKSISPLRFVDMSNWDRQPVPEQEWCVLDRIPVRQCVLFTGEGAAGKSTVQLHLSAAHVLGRDWLGSMPELGPAIFVDAEDEEGVMHRRLAAIAAHYGVTFKDMIDGGLHLVSLIGEDAVLATASRSGKIEPTPRYDQLLEAAGDIRPKTIGIASSANVFAGDEVDRAQVQQFVSLLTRLAIVANGAVVLISHPSITGINSDTGLSGSTQWHNAVRARFYLKSVKPEAGEQPDTDLRELSFRKNNYGAVGASVALRYQNGLFLPLPGMANLDKLAAEQRADEVFLDLLRRFTSENRHVSDRKSPNYAPAVFAKEDAARKAGLNGAAFANAMRRLFEKKAIWNEPCGKPSRPSYRIAVK